MKNPDVNIMDCLSGGPIKNVDVAVDAAEGIGAKVSSSHKPPIDVGRIADWLNKNHHLIRAKNYLHQDMSRNDPYNASFKGTYRSKRSIMDSAPLVVSQAKGRDLGTNSSAGRQLGATR